MVEGLLMDFYGTVVDEDHEVIRAICDRVARGAPADVTPQDVGHAWWLAFQGGKGCPGAHG